MYNKTIEQIPYNSFLEVKIKELEVFHYSIHRNRLIISLDGYTVEVFRNMMHKKLDEVLLNQKTVLKSDPIISQIKFSELNNYYVKQIETAKKSNSLIVKAILIQTLVKYFLKCLSN
jgi:hypothetical protein